MSEEAGERTLSSQDVEEDAPQTASEEHGTVAPTQEEPEQSGPGPPEPSEGNQGVPSEDTSNVVLQETEPTTQQASGDGIQLTAEGAGITTATTEASGQGIGTFDAPRQVVAVNASRGPTTFLNLARKFLITDEMCDLSALEGAIVSAVDAANLLERSKLATIVRVTTSYVTVEPRRKKQETSTQQQTEETGETSQLPPRPASSTSYDILGSQAAASRPVSGESFRGGREPRRARIVITVRRTESYKQWLLEA